MSEINSKNGESLVPLLFLLDEEGEGELDSEAIIAG